MAETGLSNTEHLILQQKARERMAEQQNIASEIAKQKKKEVDEKKRLEKLERYKYLDAGKKLGASSSEVKKSESGQALVQTKEDKIVILNEKMKTARLKMQAQYDELKCKNQERR